MTTVHVTASELTSRLGHYLTITQHAPVYVSVEGQETAVLIAAAQYAYLLALVEELDQREHDTQELLARVVEQQITINELLSNWRPPHHGTPTAPAAHT